MRWRNFLLFIPPASNPKLGTVLWKIPLKFAAGFCLLLSAYCPGLGFYQRCSVTMFILRKLVIEKTCACILYHTNFTHLTSNFCFVTKRFAQNSRFLEESHQNPEKRSVLAPPPSTQLSHTEYHGCCKFCFHIGWHFMA